VIEASWIALVDAIRLELMRLAEQGTSIERAVEDYCWGVQGRHPGRHCRV
jgi:2-isopropylmalate synthase